MYTPASFVENDLSKLHSCIEQYSFATLITSGTGGPTVSHLPLLLDRNGGPYGTLIGHMARANAQWREIADRDALAVFHGPHAYISPSWYQEKNVVPTWNYVAVHATGRARLIDEPSGLLDVVRRYVDFYEGSMPEPWRLDSADDDFIEKLLDAITGFTIEITSIEGKWKLNQNHSEERRQNVIAGLRTRPGESHSRIADLMHETLERGQ